MGHRKLFIFRWVAAFTLAAFNFLSAAGQMEKTVKFKKASGKVQKGLLENRADTLAQGYYDLGNSYYSTGDLSKSEYNYGKSKSLFEKTGDAEGLSRSSRALAQVQEDLKKNSAAVESYKTARKASVQSGDSTYSALNANDINRLSAPNDSLLQEQSLLSNINISLKNKDSDAIVRNYIKMAELREGTPAQALWSLNTASRFSQTNPVMAGKITERITNLYIEKKDVDSAVQLLLDSYRISQSNGYTLRAKKIVETLDSIYRSRGKTDNSLSLYKEFLTALPGIIAKDSSLADQMIVAETEEKIRRLEDEKAVRESLIGEKNRLNNWLIASVIVLIGVSIMILLGLKKLRRQNKKIALQSLRREMNPHFIFNSLNSINQFIANNNESAANQYLTRFSSLMRRVMENSTHDFVSLQNEIDLLKNYLELEKSRFPDKFDYTVHVDNALSDPEDLFLPGMLMQPHVENSIWHGLRYLDRKGALALSFIKEGKMLKIEINDTGIGRAESTRLKTENQKARPGRGMHNTEERIKILNELYGTQITSSVLDKVSPDSGTTVIICVPLFKSTDIENQSSHS